MTTFAYTGAEQTYTVPDGVSLIEIDLYGAEGAAGSGNGTNQAGGAGGRAKGRLAVTAGEILRVYVGGKGKTFNGGGAAQATGGAGGGASDVRQGGATLAERKIVAGGGGGGSGGTINGDPGNRADAGAGGGGFYGGGSGGAAEFVGTAGSLGAGASATATALASTVSVSGPGGTGGGLTGGTGADNTNGKGGTQTAGGAAGAIGSVGEAGSGGGGSGYIGGVTDGLMETGVRLGDGQVIITIVNRAPNAPLLVTPVGGLTIDRAITQRFDWDFSDPDAGDSQSKYDVQYRLVGAAAWTVLSVTTTSTFHDFAAATFAAGDYEWQVRTYDSQGVVGPYSASGFFTAADAPSGPTITNPINGQTIPGDTYTGTISYPELQSWEFRVLGDNAGAADPNVVIVPITSRSSTQRDFTMTGLPNNTTVHPQVRVKVNGLLSVWTDSTNPVSYTRPAVPTLAMFADNASASIAVATRNPPPNLMPTDASASFEDGTTGGFTAVANGGGTAPTIAASTDRAVDGKTALKVTLPATAAGIESGAASPVFPVGVGVTVTVSASIFVPAGSSPVQMRVDQAATANLSVDPTTETGQWQRLTRTVTMPTTGTNDIQVTFYNHDATAAGELFYVDAVQVEQAPSASAFHIPSTPVVTRNQLRIRKSGSTAIPGFLKDHATGGAQVVAPNATFTWHGPASHADYEVQVTAFADNSTSSTSDWTGAAEPVITSGSYGGY